MLYVTKRSPGNLDRAYFRQGEAPFVINDSFQPLRDASPHIDIQTVTRPQHIIGSHRKVHRQAIKVACPGFKYVSSEARQHRGAARILGIEIVERRDVCIRIGAPLNGWLIPARCGSGLRNHRPLLRLKAGLLGCRCLLLI